MSKFQELNDWLREHGGAIQGVTPSDSGVTAAGEELAAEILRSLKEFTEGNFTEGVDTEDSGA